MKRTTLLIAMTLMLLLAACAPSQGMPPILTPSPLPPGEDLPQTGPMPVDLPPAQVKAIEALAQELGISVEEIELVSLEPVEWPDGCLGVQRPDVMCTQAIVPGYRVILAAGGQKYEYHTNEDGSALVQAALSDGSGEVAGLPAAIQALAEALGLTLDEIQVVTANPVVWPNACLGVTTAGEACAEVETPGATIVLEANGVQYEYHTNADGSQVVPARLALTWRREGGIAGFCDELAVYLPYQAHPTSCNPAVSGLAGEWFPLDESELAQLNEWLRTYGQVTVERKDAASADAMTVGLTLHGQGEGQPDEAAQQAMLDWAQAVYTRLRR